MADLATDNAAACRELTGKPCTDRLFTDAYTPPVSKTPSQAYLDNEHAIYAATQIFSEKNAGGFEQADGYDNRSIWTHLTSAMFNTGRTDGSLSRDSIQEMIREYHGPMVGLGMYTETYNPKFIKSMKYIDEHWNSPEVQSMLTPDGDLDLDYVQRGIRRLETQNREIADKYADGNPYAFSPADQILGQVTIGGKVKEELTQAATVLKGEGTWKSAARILKLDGQATSEKDIKALSDALSAEYSDEQGRSGSNTSLKSLQVGHELITSDNQYLILKRISDEALRQRLQKLFERT